MDTFFLTTKIHPPRTRATRVERPRLTARLEQAIHHQLTLISAPAGSGKTTLLSTWLAQCPVPFAWVGLDEGDNDAARFAGYCITALHTLFPQIGETAMALLQTPEPLESAFITLLNELVNFQSDDFLFILDDYHLIHNQAIQQAMTFLLEHQPAHMHLMLASRVDPPFPLARLRARGELNELRLADLRFTREEAAYFCEEVMELHLSPEHIAALEERTEGWIAGLQLAALSLRDRQSSAEITAFVRSFSGRDRHVLDYLLEEVLQRLPAATQEFLLDTSILDRFSPSLCAAVHDQYKPALLEELERANLFLIPLDNERRWYRYHHLFAELLRARLHQLYPEREIALYQHAAEWYEHNNMQGEAVSYALAAQDFERAARLISDVAEGMLKRGEAATVMDWLKQLPDELVRSQLVLSLVYAMMLLATAHFEQVEDYVRVAEQALQGGEDAHSAEIRFLLGRIYTARATVAINQREYERAIKLSQRALEMLPEEDLFARGIILLNLGDAYEVNDDFARAEHFFQQAIALNQAAHNTLVTLTAMGSLGGLQERRGQLREAEQTYRQALRLSSGEQGEKGGQELPSAGKVHAFLGRLLYKRGRLEEAQEQVRRGIELCQQWGHARHLLDGYLTLAQIQQARGENDAAHATLALAQTLIEQEQRAARKPTPALSQMAQQVAEVAASETPSALIEPLSKREREILRLVAEGMSNREIAQALVMTVGTVKWYVNSIYGKLQVHGRVQAIERARALHLLPGP